MAAQSDGFLLTVVTTMLAPMSSNAYNLDACSFLRSTGRTLFPFFHSRGFYDVPRVLIADARSFQALTDHVCSRWSTIKNHTQIPVIKQQNTSNALFQSLITTSLETLYISF